ncbi:NUDIX hydrolase [Chitinolyticbacter meiyuanensis]|uniref:NUDIX hydrolase n=1 Tax=Chitinolyticbacter meiyuanensis TaxID=682798 RepID=UPI0011E5E403|nr:NUDIX domain-containing protein [Chitinolyticbacter meiyuanensis]
MAFDDLFRLSCHAVITDDQGRVLLLKSTYGTQGWGLPGGALDPAETIHEALLRECYEELGVEIRIRHLTGVYYHATYNAQAFVFRCELPQGARIRLSSEHSEHAYWVTADLSPVQQRRIRDCLAFAGEVQSARF